MLRAHTSQAIRRPGYKPSPAQLAQTRHRLRTASVRAMAGEVKTWQASVGSSAPLLDDNSTGIWYTIVDRSGQESKPATLDAWLPATPLYQSEESTKGWKRAGDVVVPREFTDPVAIKLLKKPGKAKDGKEEEDIDYVSEFRLDMGSSKVTFPVHSWVSSNHEWRVFFGPKAYLPVDTPPALLPLRKKDLAELRGDGLPASVLNAKRQGAERLYGYQVYNDLGTESEFRPALGGTDIRPYPRRIATNRRVENGQEVNVGKDPNVPPESGPWLPYDERFNYSKAQGFKGDAVLAILPAVIQGIKNIPAWKLGISIIYQVLLKVPLLNKVLPSASFPPVENFADYVDVLNLYGKDLISKGGNVEDLIKPIRQRIYPKGSDAANGVKEAAGPVKAVARAFERTTSRRFKGEDGAWDFKIGEDKAEEAEQDLAKKIAGPSVRNSLAKADGTAPPASTATATSNGHANGNGNGVHVAVTVPAPAEAALVGAKVSTSVSAAASAPAAAPAAAGAPMTDVEALPNPGAKDILGYVKKVLRQETANGGTVADEITTFDVPRSLENRPLAWDTDEEVGRQALAGMHACTITALKVTPESIGSAITNAHVVGDLQGSTLEQLVEAAAKGGKPRLYIMDYWGLSAFWDQEKPKRDMVQHAGRAVFYLRRKEVGGRVTEEDDALIPVAIELAHKLNAQGTKGVVYSRHELLADPKTAVIWRLAKAVFRSLDSAYHQLVSHWLRTHACLEPFLIALRRQLSIIHPIFKLMLPHFRYTLNINSNARASLVNAGGIIEQNFSAGEFAMRLTAVVYRNWRFRTQALPEDLKARGMVDANGRPWSEYPYAEDGLDIWKAFEEYFADFISRHYAKTGSVADGDKAIQEDAELQAWWTEVKTVGHGDLLNFGISTEEDIWGFAGPISTQAQLVRVCTTIAFTASAHHAAVNFGQYDFSGLILNFSSMIRKPMPVKGDKAWNELVNAQLGERQERALLSWLIHVVGAASVMTTVKLLSNHAEGEQTLEVPNKYLRDPEDVELNAKFVRTVLELEKKFNARNADPKSWTRAATRLNPNTMEYSLLLPTSGPGVTGRGVPYSVSI